MRKIPKHIEIVRSSRAGLSSLSRVSAAALYGVLKRHYSSVGISIVNTAADLELLADLRPDLVFLGMKYVPSADQPSDKIWVSEYLERRGIAHTGSDQPAIAYELDKPLAKQRVRDARLRTAAFAVIKNGNLPDEAELPPFPLFVKPADRGGGQGIDEHSVVRDRSELRAKVQSITEKYATDTLVETYLPGREFSVAILQDELTDELVAMPIELVAPPNRRGDRVLGATMKTSNQETVLPVHDPALRAAVTELALDVFQALGARDYGRIDLRLDAAGRPHFLEANLIPSLISGYGSFPKACLLNLGLDYQAMILQIVRLGLARSATTVPEFRASPILPALLRPAPAY